ncbi:hypothetical protein PFICI_15183 [Pestalotiopsis fici W106-1]|uniref:BTB domain-containing protein n=1 Tax=Pestalotiopsis fici (strain W106-1 / CGMCC3.15140) TaxID=1229662 RepID=W3WGH1_PESFW|nr:uncharacterized protein PFICI_15183 [Pestalotiopsis fici W106-1]ETS73008.1 hypothetical protein PFICI_15183 [Pestalotiopsis fici W106-1]
MSDLTPTQGGIAAAETTEPISRVLTPVNERDETMTDGSETFNKDADLLFKLKSNAGYVDYKVNKFNVAAASDAFGRVIFGENDGSDVIELSDDPAAFAVIMNIVHYRFILVKKEPSIEELFQICILLNKYDCTHLIQPWADNWAAVLSSFAEGKTAAAANFKALWVAWVLGCVAPFRQMADSLIVTSKVDKDGDLVHISGAKVQDLVLPQGLFDGIVDVRGKTVAALLSAIRKPMDHLTQVNRLDNDASFCKVGSEASLCEMMLLASATRILVPAGLYPVPSASKFTNSVGDIKDAVTSIRYEAWVGKTFAPHKAHTGCNLGLMDSMRTILEDMPSPVQQTHLAYLAKQARLTAVDNGDTLQGYSGLAENDGESELEDQTKVVDNGASTTTVSGPCEDAKAFDEVDEKDD